MGPWDRSHVSRCRRVCIVHPSVTLRSSQLKTTSMEQKSTPAPPSHCLCCRRPSISMYYIYAEEARLRISSYLCMLFPNKIKQTSNEAMRTTTKQRQATLCAASRCSRDHSPNGMQTKRRREPMCRATPTRSKVEERATPTTGVARESAIRHYNSKQSNMKTG